MHSACHASCSIARTIAIALTLGITAAAAPLHSQNDGNQDSRWTVRGFGLWLSSSGDDVVVVKVGPEPMTEERTTHSISDGSGFGLELEYSVKPKIGVEFTALFGDYDTDLKLQTGGIALMDSDDIGFKAFFLGVNYHFTPDSRADFFVGAFAGLSYYDDIVFFTEVGRSEKLTFDDDLGFGLKAGIDTPLRRGGPWIFSAEFRYLDTILESEIPGGDLDLNPLMLSIGLGYRF